ncbi:hypothetical protein [Halalkalibacter alkaliphilus]|uniref:Uncharacterized protein n=1 Tax=Halalkalibacter alkaliphilus TaxID=2917993 RepID=A0A9X2A1H2_9BACI|nr:hypothetical protein [Halalkalibacter alkaliphilus]MCL7746120.1 hypothetical protein [Halalkalibacter alkaliphilus]
MAMKTYVKEISKSIPKIFNETCQGNQSMYYSRGKTGKKDDDFVTLRELEHQLTDLLGSTNTEEEDVESLFTQLVQDYKEQLDRSKELEKKQKNLPVYKSPFVPLFQTLPANFPVNEVLLNGAAVEVARFINISAEGTIVHFTDDESSMKSFDINKIDGIHWGREDLNA